MKENGKLAPYWCNWWIYVIDLARPDHIDIVTHPEEGKRVKGFAIHFANSKKVGKS